MTQTLSLADVDALVRDSLMRSGVAPDVSAAVAAEVVAAETAGERAHGLEGLLRDLRLSRYGRLQPDATARRGTGEGAVLRVDAGHGFAAAALAGALEDLARLAKAQGIAILHLKRASAPGLMLATLRALKARGLVALSLNEAGEARLSDPGSALPRALRGLSTSPLMALLGLAPPEQDTPFGDLVQHHGWIVAADPGAIGPVALALGPQSDVARAHETAANDAADPGDAPTPHAGRITLPQSLLEQIVNA